MNHDLRIPSRRSLAIGSAITLLVVVAALACPLYLPQPSRGSVALDESTYRLSNPNDFTVDRTYRSIGGSPSQRRALVIHTRHDAGNAEAYSIEKPSVDEHPEFAGVESQIYYEIHGTETTRYTRSHYVHTRNSGTSPCIVDNGTIAYDVGNRSTDDTREPLSGLQTIDGLDQLTDWTKTRDGNRTIYRPKGGYYASRRLDAGGSRQVFHVHDVSGSVVVTNGYVSRSNVRMDVTFYGMLTDQFVTPLRAHSYRISYDVRRESGDVTVEEPAWVETARTCTAETRSQDLDD